MTSTVIGEGLTVEGEVVSEEEIEVGGTVRGTIRSTEVVHLAPGSVVEADVSGASVTIGGTVTGNVTSADRVDLQAGARLVGDVRTARLTIADGASFKGNVDMEL